MSEKQLDVANKEILILREALRRAIDFVERAPVSSGVCCCGDNLDGHGDPMETGHSPRDMWDYAVEGFVKDTQKVLDGGGFAHSDHALQEWHDKTEWLRKDLQPHELGKHLADVLRERLERRSEVYAVLHREIGENGFFDNMPVRPGSAQHQAVVNSPQHDYVELCVNTPRVKNAN